MTTNNVYSEVLDSKGVIRLYSIELAIELKSDALAMFISQMHYLIKGWGKLKSGKLWIYNTYDTWKDQFPHWSKSKIQRTIASLEKQKILLSEKFDKSKKDQTKWYTLNYELLNSITDNLKKVREKSPNKKILPNSQWHNASSQNESILSITKKTSSNKKVCIPKNQESIIKNTNCNEQLVKHTHIFLEENLVIKMADLWKSIINFDIAGFTEKKLLEKIIELHGYFKGSIELWKSFCSKINSSKFLRGEKGGFKLNFNFLFKRERVDEIMSDKYKDYSVKKDENDKIVAQIDEEAIRYNLTNGESKFETVTDELKTHFGEGVYKSWISRMKLHKVTDECITFSVSSNFVKEWIEEKYASGILNCFNNIGLGFKEIDFQIVAKVKEIQLTSDDIEIDKQLTQDNPKLKSFSANLINEIGREKFIGWFNRIYYITDTPETITFAVPSKFIQTIIESNYREAIMNCLRKIGLNYERLNFLAPGEVVIE